MFRLFINGGMGACPHPKMNTPPPSDASSVSAPTEYDDMYDMLISDLLELRDLNPLWSMAALFRELVLRGHTGLRQFPVRIGSPVSPTPARGSRVNLNLVEIQGMNTGSSSSPLRRNLDFLE